MKAFKSILFVFLFLGMGALTMHLAVRIFGKQGVTDSALGDSRAEPMAPISEEEVVIAQQLWGEGIVQIGRIFKDGGDYVAAAQAHIDRFYGYDLGPVLFKPTLASQKQFRNNTEGALSYFVAGNPAYPEDHGFALKPWREVRWESAGISLFGEIALAMGNYYFFPDDGGPAVQVEYSFAYTRDVQGALRIILHDSHKPYAH